MTMRLPFAISAALSFAGGSGHASPNSTDSVSVASGRESPMVIMRPTLHQRRASSDQNVGSEIWNGYVLRVATVVRGKWSALVAATMQAAKAGDMWLKS